MFLETLGPIDIWCPGQSVQGLNLTLLFMYCQIFWHDLLLLALLSGLDDNKACDNTFYCAFKVSQSLKLALLFRDIYTESLY